MFITNKRMQACTVGILHTPTLSGQRLKLVSLCLSQAWNELDSMTHATTSYGAGTYLENTHVFF